MVLEKLIITRSIDDIEMKYTYSLTKESLNNVQAYGIKVDRVDIKDGAIINRVEDGVKYISTQRHKVKGLLNLLYKNEVSPIHLIDIIGEYVDKWVEDFAAMNLLRSGSPGISTVRAKSPSFAVIWGVGIFGFAMIKSPFLCFNFNMGDSIITG